MHIMIRRIRQIVFAELRRKTRKNIPEKFRQNSGKMQLWYTVYIHYARTLQHKYGLFHVVNYESILMHVTSKCHGVNQP